MEKTEKKTGLVLEGGAMRGLYTAGVLDSFMDNGITFDGVLGVSAGAIHGCSYVSGQRGRSIRYYRKYRSDKRFMSLYSLVTTGDIVGEKFCYHDIPDRLDPFDHEAFRKSNTDFYVGCTNLETGKAEYRKITNMISQVDLLRASATMPIVSRTVRYKGEKLVDGGCADSIPVRAFRKMGYKKTVVVLTREDGYKKKPQRMEPLQVLYHSYPAFLKAMKERHLNYNCTLDYIRGLERGKKIFVIRPSEPITISRMETDMDKINKVYALGYKDGMSSLEGMLSYLQDR